LVKKRGKIDWGIRKFEKKPLKRLQFLNSNGIIRILNSSVMGIESGCATLNIRYMG
jgi:hypothetical protein